MYKHSWDMGCQCTQGRRPKGVQDAWVCAGQACQGGVSAPRFPRNSALPAGRVLGQFLHALPLQPTGATAGRGGSWRQLSLCGLGCARPEVEQECGAGCGKLSTCFWIDTADLASVASYHHS